MSDNDLLYTWELCACFVLFTTLPLERFLALYGDADSPNGDCGRDDNDFRALRRHNDDDTDCVQFMDRIFWEEHIVIC